MIKHLFTTKHSKLFGLVFVCFALLQPVPLRSHPLPQSASDIAVNGSLTPEKTKKGRTVRGSVVMDIPAGLHVQSNKPLDKFLIPTKLELETPGEMRVGPISYPRAVTRKLKFSKGAVAVYEGRATIRFTVNVPANYSGSSTEIKGKLRFQACTDESCFAPVTREVKMWLNVE